MRYEEVFRNLVGQQQTPMSQLQVVFLCYLPLRLTGIIVNLK